jgi:LuxR family maltose regulon positive regulatory protein
MRVDQGKQQLGEAPLLTSKLTAPTGSDGLVARTRLDRLLESGADAPVTLLAAPAGWGKTTALGSWLRRRNHGAVAWLTLEPGDEGNRFWAYVHAAFEPSVVDLAPPEAAPPDVYLARLANALSQQRDPVVLVLDDFHQVQDQNTIAGLDFLLRHAAATFRLVLATRIYPTLPLHRWRLSGELTEIGAEQLAFTDPETGELLAAHGLALPSAHRNALRERTEGWPAGLRLAALSMQARADPAAFVEQFDGDDQNISDYLVEEVLAEQPAGVRDALRCVSVLTAICGPLVDALTGRTDGEQILTRLEHDNAFVVRLDGRPSWYRLRPLFGELLGAELHRHEPEKVGELHRRAARWHETQGSTADALRHFLAAEDWSSAASLVLERWPDLMLCEHRQATRDPSPMRLEPPPEDVLRADPELALACAADRLEVNDFDGAAHLVGVAEQHLDRLCVERRRRLAVVVEAFRLAGAQHQGDFAAVLAIAPRLLALSDAIVTPGAESGVETAVEPATESAASTVDTADCEPTSTEQDRRLRDSARAIAFATLGMAELNTGDLDNAELLLTSGLANAERVGLACPLAVCTSRLALLHALRGALHLAEMTAQAALTMPPCPCDCRPAHSAHAYLAVAIVHYQRDRADDAARYVDLAARFAMRGNAVFVLCLSMVRAWLLQGERDPMQGFEALRDGRRRLGDRPAASWLRNWHTATEADMLTARGHTTAARGLLRAAVAATSTQPASTPMQSPLTPVQSPFLALSLARTYLRDDDPGAAIRALPPWSKDATIFASHRLEAGIIDALAARATGQPARAAESLEHVLRLAEPDGFRRIFTRGGTQLHSLLATHLSSGTAHWSMLTAVMDAAEHMPVDVRPAPHVLVEALTERERTVLRYLQGALSIAEIASALFLSTNTVKTHVRHIYRKLDAGQRRHAVQRARDLRLL